MINICEYHSGFCTVTRTHMINNTRRIFLTTVTGYIRVLYILVAISLLDRLRPYKRKHYIFITSLYKTQICYRRCISVRDLGYFIWYTD
jgi:hypothetical protein